jgi:hypothetical protein
MQLLDVDADTEPSPADLAWARSLVEDPCAPPPPVPPPAPALARMPAPAAPPASVPG